MFCFNTLVFGVDLSLSQSICISLCFLCVFVSLSVCVCECVCVSSLCVPLCVSVSVSPSFLCVSLTLFLKVSKSMLLGCLSFFPSLYNNIYKIILYLSDNKNETCNPFLMTHINYFPIRILLCTRQRSLKNRSITHHSMYK